MYVKSSGATAITDLPNWLPYGDTIYVEHFGASTVAARSQANASSVDTTSAITAAIAYAELLGASTVWLRQNYYRVTSTIELSKRNLVLRGAGSQETHVFADHTSGPVIRISDQSIQVINLSIEASDARRDSWDAADPDAGKLNVGILYQTADDSGRMQNNFIRDVTVSNQPSHGIHISATAYTGTVDRAWIQNNRGHGVLIDRMVDRNDVSGLCTFNECQVKHNYGHGFSLGSRDIAQGLQATRVAISNCEISVNAQNAASYTEGARAQVFMHGVADVFVYTNVFGCDADGGTGPTGSVGVWIEGGRNVQMLNNRWKENCIHAAVIDSSPLYHTINVFIEAMTIITSTDMVEAVLVQNTTGDASLEPKGISVKQYNYIGGVNTLVGTGPGMDSGSGAWRVPELGLGGRRLSSNKLVTQSVTDSTTHVTDDHLKFWVVPNEVVLFSMTIGYQGQEDLKLRIVGPSGCTIGFGVAGATAPARLISGDEDLVLSTTSPGEAYVATLQGKVKNGSLAGTVALKWAQNVANSSTPTQVLSDVSFLTLDRVAL